MYTISKLARKFGLSRATLLYYEREGLIKPTTRAANDYRYFGENEVNRLRRIVGYRSYGVPVKDIRELLDKESDVATEKILRKRFDSLEEEIRKLRDQQSALISILEHSKFGTQPAMTKERWTSIMEAAGMSDQDMMNWHKEFEAREPEGHQEFLESLNIDSVEIQQIRQQSKEP
jgi:DNA-binding transcriptional MerR regulator